ncbi:TonB-dependent siderophore receptor [Duganella sp. FT80W]|uniref:TonB-dependent siderophore receptor n=1 Tax=Duganella guangzhouensis TaxID=2666084 RepID=A0A6I2KY76_9BURK|nr:TonB-dependent receptor [Duganella guangzhouensis]MRW89937.1 TonB-dependent siderophore receptor [Duganella guangzhouensis]
MPHALPRFPLAPLSLAVALALTTPAWVHAQSTGQPLGDALNEFSSVSGIPVAFPPALVAGKTAPAVTGTLTPQQALARLLAGSGLEAQQQGATIIIVRAAESTLPLVSVAASALQPDALPAVYAGGQVADGSRLGLLGNREVLDTPFSVTSYTAELIANQQAVSVADVMANDPAVRTVSYGLTNAAGAGDSFMIRGFYVQNSVLFDGMYGIAPSRTLPVETAERVEVLKGPNALLNGMAPYDASGGAINLVPKRAGDTPLTRLTANYIGDGIFGSHLDLSRRFGERQQWGVRVNGVYRNGDTSTDHQKLDLRAFTVAIDYRGERLRASLDAGHQTMNNQAPQGAGGLGFADGIAIPAAPDGRRQTAQDWEYAHTKSDYALGKLEYDLAPAWTVYGAAGYSNNRFTYLSTDIYVTDSAGNAQATAYYWPDFNDYRSVQGGARGSVTVAGLKHQLNLTSAYLKREHGYTVDYYGIQSFDTNIYHPSFVGAPSLAGFAADAAKTDQLELGSYAISDTISSTDERIVVTLGARRQNIKYLTYDSSNGAASVTYDQGATTPVLAVLFKLRPNLSLYGNYIEGLSQGDTAPIGTTNAGQVFAPKESKQYELGAKVDFGRFSAAAALFQISRPSGLIIANSDGSSTYKVDGEQRNRGLELTFFGEPAPGLRALGGVVITDARLTHTDGGLYDDNLAPNVSRRQLNLGTEYDWPGVAGLTVTARLTATSSQVIDQDNQRSIPGWTRWDAGARYATVAWSHPLTLRASVSNLLARTYWASGSGAWLYPAQPRTVALSASIDF